jgi:hypothetical protein
MLEIEEVDNSQITGIVVYIFVAFLCVRWWFTSKGTSYRKYTLLLSICWLVTGIAYIIAKSFDIPGLMVIVLLAFLVAIYFLIKAGLSERKAKRKSPDD